MKELIKDILTLAKAIFSDEERKNGLENMGHADFFHTAYSMKKDDLSIDIGFDCFGRPFDDDKDLYRYVLVVDPDSGDSNQCIRLKYDFYKDLFLCQRVYKKSGASRKFKDKTMLKHIHDVLKCIAEERGIREI